MTLFLAQLVALFSALFALGGVCYLSLRHRTRLLQYMLLFLLSLLLISLGFFTMSLKALIPSLGGGAFIFQWIFHLSGGGLNIAILPYLVSALCAKPMGKGSSLIFGGWTGIYILGGLSYFLFPQLSWTGWILTAMQLVTIFASLLYMLISLGQLKKIWWYGAIKGFFILSALFLILLTLDVAISLLPIFVLNFLDGLSVPIYLTLLNLGIFYFSYGYLSRDALVDQGKLTDDCLKYFQLTPREGEIVEALLKGGANKVIAEELFISPKTVENHLSNIYQKCYVKGRTQLIQMLQNWDKRH